MAAIDPKSISAHELVMNTYAAASSSRIHWLLSSRIESDRFPGRPQFNRRPPVMLSQDLRMSSGTRCDAFNLPCLVVLLGFEG